MQDIKYSILLETDDRKSPK